MLLLHCGAIPRLWGMFQMPTVNGSGASNGSMDGMWETFNFNADFKAPIDAIKAAGGNFMAGFLAADFLRSGNISTPTFLSRLTQVMDYMASQGINYLPYAYTTQSEWLSGLTLTAVGNLIAAECALLGSYSNLAGFVTQDESSQGSSITGTELTSVSTLYPYARNNLPAAVPVCACPNPQGNGNTVGSYGGQSQTNTDAVQGYCEVFIYHPFLQITAANFTAVRAAYPGRKIWFPSAVDSAYNGGTTAGIVNSIMGLTRKDGFNNFGWFATVDSTVGDNTGFFDASYTPHAADLSLFQANIG